MVGELKLSLPLRSLHSVHGTEKSELGWVELTLGPRRLDILLRQASLMVAKWLPPALSFISCHGEQESPRWF